MKSQDLSLSPHRFELKKAFSEGIPSVNGLATDIDPFLVLTTLIIPAVIHRPIYSRNQFIVFFFFLIYWFVNLIMSKIFEAFI
jgi:hypothetical protein